MNCKETQNWLLHSETPALPPPPLADHLRRCPTCQQSHRQLMLVETHLQAAPLPLVPVAIKAQLMNAIVAAPAVRPATRSLVKRRKRRLPLEHIIGYFSAAAAALLLGGVLGYGYSERSRNTTDLVAKSSASSGNTQPVKEVDAVVGAAANAVTSVVPAAEPKPNIENVAKPPKVEVVQTLPNPAPSLVDPDVTVPTPFVPRPMQELALTTGDVRLLSDAELLAALVDSHTQTAAATAPHDRLAQLVSLSDVLWKQSIKEAEGSNSAGNLEWLTDAYTSLVENDLPALARDLPPSQQPTVISVASDLDQRAAQVDMLLAAKTPMNAELLRQLQASTQHGAARLTKKEKEPSSPRQRHSGGGTNLLPLVVEQTVAIAREDNPLERADHSTALAEGLAKDILVTSLRGDETRAADLGGYFGRVLEQGVAINLKRIDPTKATYQQSRRYQQVVARTQQSILFLQQSLEAAPPSARQSLSVAMQQGGLAQLVPPPGPTRQIWIWSPKNFQWPPARYHRH